jgi:methylthioribose-1-phosphate isomerase
MPAEVVPCTILPGRGVEILDQTLLPLEERRVLVDSLGAMCEAISALRVRGAPLLGIMAACGMAIAATTQGTSDHVLRAAAGTIETTRPTAVDLGAAVRNSLAAALAAPQADRTGLLWDHALQFAEQRKAEDRQLAAFGAPLLTGAVLTHCNTGALATGGIGTALGVIRVAWESGRLERCYATETRPLLQGARLTMWELTQLAIPATLLPDTAAASLVASGKVSAVITGADRIAANGDTANKIGTYGLALAAHHHGIPFYIAAPMTTIDLACPDGTRIPIEQRDPREVGGFGPVRWSPEGIDAFNPAFDVTPADLIAAIITERGIARPPFDAAIAQLAP